MAETISVRVEGHIGLDDPAYLLEELNRETGLVWRQRPTPPGALSGVSELVLDAVVQGVVGWGIQHAAQTVVAKFQNRHLDQPTATVRIVPDDAQGDGSRIDSGGEDRQDDSHDQGGTGGPDSAPRS
jgi:hypothetical protein